MNQIKLALQSTVKTILPVVVQPVKHFRERHAFYDFISKQLIAPTRRGTEILTRVLREASPEEQEKVLRHLDELSPC